MPLNYWEYSRFYIYEFFFYKLNYTLLPPFTTIALDELFTEDIDEDYPFL